MCVCVCVCVCECEHAWVGAYVRACAYVCVCLGAYVRVEVLWHEKWRKAMALPWNLASYIVGEPGSVLLSTGDSQEAGHPTTKLRQSAHTAQKKNTGGNATYIYISNKTDGNEGLQHRKMRARLSHLILITIHTIAPVWARSIPISLWDFIWRFYALIHAFLLL